jgi:addiction module RelE/StbE family toxin
VKPATVIITDKVHKRIQKLPKSIRIQLQAWASYIEKYGYTEMQKITGYRDHSLKGNLIGLRSSSINRSYRVIYRVNELEMVVIEIIEVNKHDYKI